MTTTHTQRGSVTVDAYQWTGGQLYNLVLPGWLRQLAIHTPGNSYLHVPTRNGGAQAKVGDWIVKDADGSVTIMSNTAFTDLYS